MSDDFDDRLDRLESLVEQQQATIERQRDRIADLEADESAADGDDSDTETDADAFERVGVSRRDALKAGGLLALLGGVGAETASASSPNPQGKVGTSTRPLTNLYTNKLASGSGQGRVALGDNLDLEGNTITDTSGNVTLGSTLDFASHVALDSNGPLTLGSKLDTNGADIEDSGTTLWDSSGGHVPYGSQQTPPNLLVVAKSGGDYDSVSNALASITDNSASNPYAIKVEPGVYNDTIRLKSHVDIVGAGPNATRITASQTLASNGTLQLNGASNVAVQNMTVRGTAAAVSGTTSGSDVTLQRVRLRNTSSTSRVILFERGRLTLRDCIVQATGGSSSGLVMSGGTVTVAGSHVDATSSGIELNSGSSPTATVRRSFIEGDTIALNVASSSGITVRAAYSQLRNGVSGTLDKKFSVHNDYTGI